MISMDVYQRGFANNHTLNSSGNTMTLILLHFQEQRLRFSDNKTHTNKHRYFIEHFSQRMQIVNQMFYSSSYYRE